MTLPVMAQAKTIAKALDLPTSTFRHYVREGLLPPGIKIGRHRLWNTQAVLGAVDGLGRAMYKPTDDPDETAHGRTPAHRETAQRHGGEDSVLLEPRSRNGKRGGEGAPAGRSIFAGVLGRA